MKAGDWLDKLRVEVCGMDETPPPGYVCATDIQKRYKFKGVGTAKRLMNKIIASGKAHAIKVKRRTSRGAAVVTYIGPPSKPIQRPHPRPMRVRND